MLWRRMPVVSAVITTYERPDDCERAVASALAQEPAPIEVLVCDDGSSVASAARLEALAAREPLVRYLRIEPNRGTPAAPRNLGIREARGDWIAFLDDDDEWLPGKLARQLELTDRSDVIGGNAVTDAGAYFDGALDILWPQRREVIRANPLIQSTVIARKELLV